MLFTEYYITKSNMLVESAAFGHVSNLWEDKELTKQDYKTIIEQAISGTLEEVYEKTDGQNLFISYKNKEIVFSRNKQQLKAPLTFEQLKLFFKDNLPNVTNTFITAANDLITAIKTIPEKELVDIFQEGKNFISLEVINKNTINVIDYFQNLFIPHMLLKYDNGLVISYDREIASNLFKRLPQKLEHYKIKVLEKVKYEVPNYDDTKDKLLEQYLNELETTDNIENLFLKFGTDILKYIKKDLITSKSDETIIEIKNRLKIQIKDIQETGTDKELEKLNKQLGRFKICGEWKNISATEGIVFSYKDKILKLTGSFGPVNSILGIRKYEI